MDTKTNDNSQLMGILAYIGPLVIIPLLAAKDNPFVKFHVKQGLVLFIIEIIVGFLAPMFFWSLWAIVQLVNLATLILSIMGIINVTQKQEKELPVVGGFAKHFTF